MANMTFYIKPDVEKKLKKLTDSSMGGLINHLLEQFFDTHKSTTTLTTIDMPPVERQSFTKNVKEIEQHTMFMRNPKKGKL